MNQFAFHDGKYRWKGDDLNELKEQAKKYRSLEEQLTTSPQLDYDDIAALKYQVDDSGG